MAGHESYSLRSDFLKTWITTTVAAIAGEIALLNTAYKNEEIIWPLCLSIVCFMVSIMFWLGAYEAIVIKSAGNPKFDNRFLSWYSNLTPRGDKADWIYSGIGGIIFGTGVASMIYFMIVSYI